MKKINELTTGQRFFYGMWHDFSHCEARKNTFIVTVTNGFDDSKYQLIVPCDSIVRISH